jgi:hypothetical protein
MRSKKFGRYVILLHSPVVNRAGETVVTSVTNLDLHDISRTALTYGAKALYIVTPIEDQHQLISEILEHWKIEKYATRHPDRAEALNLVKLAWSFEDAKVDILKVEGEEPEVVLTSAKEDPYFIDKIPEQCVTTAEFRAKAEAIARPLAIVFGTGWGVSKEFYPEVDWALKPLCGATKKGYNHLSVRAASGIIMDRLFGL